MALTPYVRTDQDSKASQRAQDSAESSLKSILSKEIIDGVLIEDVILVAGQDNLVAHKLGRTPRGYLVVRCSSQASVWDSEPVYPDKFLELQSSANIIVSLWIF